MELDRAKEIVQALADGVDPYTGDRFPADGPYQRADTVRALYAILEAAESGTKPKKPVDPNKPRAGGKWTEEEEQRLRDAFNARKPFADIAKDHGRTQGAITARLVKLGLVEDNQLNRSGQGHPPAAGMSRRSPGGAKTDQGNRPPDPSPQSQPAPVDPEDCPF